MLAFFSANVYGFESEGFLFDVISEEDLTVELSFVNYSDNLERVDIPATISHEGKTYNVTVRTSQLSKGLFPINDPNRICVTVSGIEITDVEYRQFWK